MPDPDGAVNTPPGHPDEGHVSGVVPWFVTACLVLATAGYLMAVAGALQRPPNRGADRAWLVVTVILFLATCRAVFVRPRRPRLVGVGVLCLGAAMILLTGHLKAALITAWLLGLAAAWGSALLTRVGVRDAVPLLEWTVVAIPLGLALLAMVGLALALAHVLRPWPIFAALVALTLARSKRWPQGWRSLCRGWSLLRGRGNDTVLPEKNAVVGAFRLSFLLALMWAVVPEIQFDALNYQLAVPRIYLSEGRLVDIPYFFHSYFAHLVNMLFAVGLALDGQGVAKLLTLAVGVVVTAGTHALGRRAFSQRVGLWAACLFCSTPLVIWLASTTYVDLAATMFVLASILALLRWGESKALGWMWASGCLLGAAVGTKLTVVVALPAMAVILVASLLRTPHPSGGSTLKALGVLACSSLLFAGPWYAIVYAFTGNPTFPMFNAVFKSPGWPAVNTRFNADLFGIGTSLRDLLSLPFMLIFATQKFGEALPPGALGLGLALLPLSVLLLASRGRQARALAGAALGAAICWGLLFQYGRYLVPVLPLIILVVVAIVLRVPSPKWTLRLNLALLALVVGTQFAVAPLLFWNIPERFPFWRALALETADAFTSRALPGYPAARFINRVSSPGEWVIGMSLQNVRFYVNPPLVSGETPGILPLGGHGSPQELAAALVKGGYAYLMVDTRQPANTDAYPFTRPEFLACCAAPKFARNGVVVYRILPRPPDAVPSTATNLLLNPSFETLDACGEVEGWRAYGVGTPDVNGHSGKIAILGSAFGGLVQRVPIVAGKLYILSHVTRAEQPRQYARLQINWLNGQRKLVEISVEVVPAQTQWARHVMMVTAPEGATTAAVYAAVDGDSSVWFDDFTLTAHE